MARRIHNVSTRKRPKATTRPPTKPRKRARAKPFEFLTTCIGCGCTDIQACDNGLGDPCYWISVNHARRVGVCSECAIRMFNAILFPEATDAEINREIMRAARS